MLATDFMPTHFFLISFQVKDLTDFLVPSDTAWTDTLALHLYYAKFHLTINCYAS